MNKGLIFGALGLLFGGVADYMNGEQMKEEVRLTVIEELDKRLEGFGRNDHIILRKRNDN